MNPSYTLRNKKVWVARESSNQLNPVQHLTPPFSMIVEVPIEPDNLSLTTLRS